MTLYTAFIESFKKNGFPAHRAGILPQKNEITIKKEDLTTSKEEQTIKIDLNDNNKEQVEIKGHVINTDLNILGKDKIEDLNLFFS